MATQPCEPYGPFPLYGMLRGAGAPALCLRLRTPAPLPTAVTPRPPKAHQPSCDARRCPPPEYDSRLLADPRLLVYGASYGMSQSCSPWHSYSPSSIPLLVPGAGQPPNSFRALLLPLGLLSLVAMLVLLLLALLRLLLYPMDPYDPRSEESCGEGGGYGGAGPGDGARGRSGDVPNNKGASEIGLMVASVAL